jgi:hypothetical protein
MLDTKKNHLNLSKSLNSTNRPRNQKNGSFFSYAYNTLSKIFNFFWIKTGKCLWFLSTGTFYYYF